LRTSSPFSPIKRKRKINPPNSFRILILILIFSLLHTASFSQAPSISYLTPQSYTVGVPIGILQPINTGGAISPILGPVTTLAGQTGQGYVNGTGTAASFRYPFGVACDATGNIFVADYDNNVIRKITPAGIVTTFAGSGAIGLVDGPATSAKFHEPTGLAIDQSGIIYVADISNNVIRKITPDGTVSTFVTSLSGPTGVGVDKAGNVYIVDKNNCAIKKATPQGVVTTIAGGNSPGYADGQGVNARFYYPQSLVLDAADNIYVADYAGNRIRKITPDGFVTTIAGNGVQASVDGLGTAASFNRPIGIALSPSGSLFVSDLDGGVIRIISPTGVVSTYPNTRFANPSGLNFDHIGNLYIPEQSGRILKIVTSGYFIDKDLPAGLTFDNSTGKISGIPTAVSPLTTYTVTAYNGVGTSSTEINIEVTTIPLKPSVITFPQLIATKSDVNTDIKPLISSTNNETPITLTSSNTAVAIITATGQIHIVGSGTTIITASQNGNSNYNPATDVPQTLTIKDTQTISFTDITGKSTCDVDFPVVVTTSNPGNTINYTSNNPSVATISTLGIIHIVGSGSTIITASQSGTTLYDPATPQSRTLSVSEPIKPQVNITPDKTSLCPGMSINFTASVLNLTTNLSYKWLVNGIQIGDNSPVLNVANPSTGDKVQCIVTNNASCSVAGSSDIFYLTISNYIKPSITIQSSLTGPSCSGAPITFTAKTSNAGDNPSYKWEINNVDVNVNSSSFTTSDLKNNDLVSCELTAGGTGCFTSPTVSSNSIAAIVIEPDKMVPSVEINTKTNSIYSGTTVTFNAVIQNAPNSFNYQWQINNTNAGYNSPVFITTGLKNNDKITCILYFNSGCTPAVKSEAIVMQVAPLTVIHIPNAFTPNGDGINDFWDIPDLAHYSNCEVSVFNRYGKLLYRSKGYPNPWDIIDMGYNGVKISGSVAIIK
jgi:gliding motility-associated-like protein